MLRLQQVNNLHHDLTKKSNEGKVEGERRAELERRECKKVITAQEEKIEREFPDDVGEENKYSNLKKSIKSFKREMHEWKL